MDATSAENIIELIQEANRDEDVEVSIGLNKYLHKSVISLPPVLLIFLVKTC